MDTIYFNFPVVLLKDAFGDIKGIMEGIVCYCIYRISLEGCCEEKIKNAANYFEIEPKNEEAIYEKGKLLYESTIKDKVMVGINKKILLDFYGNHKTNDEIAVLLAFLAFKSIIGRKKYAKTTNLFLLCRMSGCNSMNEFGQIPESLRKYKTRWMLDKIKAELCENWNLALYGYRLKGYFFSFKIDVLKLAEIAEQKRLQNKIKNYKNAQAKARINAIEKIKYKQMNQYFGNEKLEKDFHHVTNNFNSTNNLKNVLN